MTPPEQPSDVIYKYPLDPHPTGTPLRLPVGAQIVHVATQGTLAHLWIQHTTDPAAQKELRVFWTVGTGQEFPSGMTHRGTFFLGPYVWHVLESAV